MSNIDYLLVSGVFVAAGLALFLMLLRVLVAAQAIKAVIYSLPVG